MTVILLLSLTFTAAAQESLPVTYAYTYHQRTGNRIVNGLGTFPNLIAMDFHLNESPRWAVGTHLNRRPIWVTVGENGGVTTLTASGPVECSETVPVCAFTASIPPIVTVDSGGQIIPWISTGVAGSIFTHALWLKYPPEGTELLFIHDQGDIVRLISDFSESGRLALNALPDARIVVNAVGQMAVYINATNQRYVHGVLGDDLEAAALVVLQVADDNLEVVTRIDLTGNDVFEGIAPMWADVDQDGTDDLITTVSNGQQGAQIRVFRADGALLAVGPTIGQGGRWRHQLAFAEFGPNGEFELVDVLTPHIGGVVEFYRLNGDQLEIVASLPGYSSHRLGSRNLDMAVAGDFNGDGTPEIVLPTQDYTAIAGLQRTPENVEEVWRLPLDGPLSTNLAAVTLPDNTLILGAGTIDHRLRVWLPSN